MDSNVIEVNAVLDILWIMVAGILVFFMQAGFTLVESGFTRSKNVINIVMKNLMDLAIGSIAFWIFGYTLMYGESIGGFIGSPSLFYNVREDMHNLFFQTVFCTTTATIVSGAIAERTKFSAYIVFSLVMTTLIYPVSGHWIWQGKGWLTNMGFIDFAGSTAVHAVGGCAALVMASMVGPRIGKYTEGKSNAIPGHNMMFGALGIFILWMGWFGFNGGSELAISGESVFNVPAIIVNTNLSAAAGLVTAIILTWIRYGKPEISMSLNGALAGLVSVTAGCAIVSPGGSVIIGIICGIAVIFAIELIDKKLKVDDPVGAVAVHGVCGVLGTLLVGIFATEGGLLYGGGFSLLGIQAIGVLSVCAWALGSSFLVLLIIKKTIGLRVTKEEEIDGLDIHEHNGDAYPDFTIDR